MVSMADGSATPRTIKAVRSSRGANAHTAPADIFHLRCGRFGIDSCRGYRHRQRTSTPAAGGFNPASDAIIAVQLDPGRQRGPALECREQPIWSTVRAIGGHFHAHGNTFGNIRVANESAVGVCRRTGHDDRAHHARHRCTCRPTTGPATCWVSPLPSPLRFPAVGVGRCPCRFPLCPGGWGPSTDASWRAAGQSAMHLCWPSAMME
jgi:hypothetical protein